MEVIFAASGPLHWLHQFENQLEAQMFSLPFVNPIGQKGEQSTGGLFEPIQLYRMIVPKDAMPLMLRTLRVGFPSTVKDKFDGLPIFALRKILGLKEIPPDPANCNYTVGPALPVNTEHIQILPIGVKYDAINMIAPTGVVQERL